MSETNTAVDEFSHIDLALPEEKKPTTIAEFDKSFGCEPTTVGWKVGSEYALGSSKEGELVYHKEDLGLFQGVYEAWKHHWNLRTSPEDWWMPVAIRIAKGIDKAAKAEAGKERQPVRDLFVDHEGKKTISVDLPVYTIDEIDCNSLFANISSQIDRGIKLKSFATGMQNDFSTSTGTHRISSQINLMASMQEFFHYSTGLCGCGIKSLEMLGEQEDWDRLLLKFQDLRKQIEPVQWQTELYMDWWNQVETVFRNLAATFAASRAGIVNDELAQFWSDILIDGNGIKHYGPSGMQRREVEEYTGWLVKFLTGMSRILKEDFNDKETKEKLKGLNTVPMEVVMKYVSPPIKENAKLVSGIMGFRLHDEGTANGIPSVQPHHMWAMKLRPNSPARGIGAKRAKTPKRPFSDEDY